MEIEIKIADLYEGIKDKILQQDEDYIAKFKEYGRLTNEFEDELKLTKEQKEKFESIFSIIYNLEDRLNKRAFIYGYKIGQGLKD